MKYPETYYHPAGDTFDAQRFAAQLQYLRSFHAGNMRPLLFLCIGSEQIIGDSLGPLVGHRLSQYIQGQSGDSDTAVLGTLKAPVHALNLAHAQELIHNHYSEYTVIAIDASLGQTPAHIGCITLSNQGIAPGLGVSKQLPFVGDISITGIVGCQYPGKTVLCAEEHQLATTHLSLVVELADAICSGITAYLQQQQQPTLRHSSCYF